MLRSTCLVSLLMVIAATRADEPSAAEKELFHDPFVGKLAKGWTWVREAPGSPAFAVAGSAMHKSWRVFQHGLVMRVLPGFLHAKTNDSSNILLRPLPENGDKPLAIEVALHSKPRIPYEHAGLVWYYDDDHYVGLFREFLGSKPQVLMVTEKWAAPKFHYGVHDDGIIFLRLEVADGKVTGKFRGSDEEPWHTIGHSTLPVPGKDSKARVGLHTGGGPQAAGRFVRFWDFYIKEIQQKKAEKAKDEKQNK